jgi:hypothetical protein
VTAALSRAQLFSRGVRGGAAILVAGSATAFLAGSAAADTIPDADLAYARLLVGAELLASDFYTRAIASKRLSGDALKCLKRALFIEKEHYQAVSGILSGAGQALQTNALKLPAARIAASEAEHLSVFAQLLGRDQVGIPFPNPLTIDEASNALDAFSS